MRFAVRLLLGASLGFAAALPASAAPSQCPQHFFGGQAPDIAANVAKGAVELCKGGFAVIYSPVTLGPLVAADHITRDTVAGARQSGRNGSFHPEADLPRGMRRTTVADYRSPPGTFFDRGHMVPNGDMPTPELQAETFTLANIVPQNAHNNEVFWAAVEGAVRQRAVQSGDVWVVTGPVFQPDASGQYHRLNDAAYIPSQVFKAFFVPSTGEVGVYLSDNTEESAWRSISLSELQQLTRIDVFPGLPAVRKNEVARLDPPRAIRTQSRQSQAEGGNPSPEGQPARREESGSLTGRAMHEADDMAKRAMHNLRSMLR